MGHLQLSLSDNYHSDGVRLDSKRKREYLIQVRRDKPFTIDFSREPNVVFASPAADQTFHPGDEVQIAAVLVDPALDAMIRGLDDTSRKEKRKINNVEQPFERYVSLDPTVTITNAAGDKLFKGKMPFG